MRLDKYLCEMKAGSRSQVRELLRQGLVTVNGTAVRQADRKIDENADRVCLQGRELCYRKFFYFMLNKPGEVVSATCDNRDKTVLELLRKEDQRGDLFPVGRLDKDTEGFLLLTNDGELAHRLLSPKRHVDKTYLATLEREPSDEELRRLEQGVEIGEDRPTLPGKVRRQGERQILLTIHEGKFHQVKRMAQAVDNRVTALKRVSFGGLYLDENLRPGEYRPLSEEEVGQLRNACEG